MAGIYIHIPFCRKACRYCDFYFNVSFRQKNDVISCLTREIENRKNEFEGELIETIYFGGGTPSVLEHLEIQEILFTIFRNYKVDKSAEISFEANPDDLKTDYINMLRDQGINRLSIGVQSFDERDLELLRRSHNVKHSLEAIEQSKIQGFDNINIDLIYGIPGQSSGTWEKNIELALGMGIHHISSYHLTFEKGTVLDHWKKKGKIIPVDEEESLRLFEMLISKTSQAGFEHYEISNFALNGFRSKHNCNYWKQVGYIGIGPSAHSFNGKTRRWNISNNIRYVDSIRRKNDNYFEYENLSQTDLYNEYILTSLRTIWGADLKEIEYRFGDQYTSYTRKEAEKFINNGELIINQNILKLSRKGIFISDYIISSLFKTE